MGFIKRPMLHATARRFTWTVKICTSKNTNKLSKQLKSINTSYTITWIYNDKIQGKTKACKKPQVQVHGTKFFKCDHGNWSQTEQKGRGNNDAAWNCTKISWFTHNVRSSKRTTANNFLTKYVKTRYIALILGVPWAIETYKIDFHFTVWIQSLMHFLCKHTTSPWPCQ